MSKKDPVLTGVLLASSSVYHTYRIAHIYRPRATILNGFFQIEVGRDLKQHIDYPFIESALGDAYAPWIGKIWKRKHTHHPQTYFQFQQYASPRLVGLKGNWRLWAIL